MDFRIAAARLAVAANRARASAWPPQSAGDLDFIGSRGVLVVFNTETDADAFSRALIEARGGSVPAGDMDPLS